jgi:hypothetical protein
MKTGSTEVLLDTQDFTENLQTWLDIYRDNHKVILPENEKDEEQKSWETSMIRIASILAIPEPLRDTPAQFLILRIINSAGTGDRSRLKEIYDNGCVLEKYLKGK